jgi:hypothetical protein
MFAIKDNVYSTLCLSFSLSLLFILLTSPYTFRYSQRVVYKSTGVTIADDEGKAYASGVLLHSLLFFIFSMSIISSDYIMLALNIFAVMMVVLYL